MDCAAGPGPRPGPPGTLPHGGPGDAQGRCCGAHTGLRDCRVSVMPQALSYGLWPTRLLRMRWGRAIFWVHLPASNTRDRSPLLWAWIFLIVLGSKELVFAEK